MQALERRMKCLMDFRLYSHANRSIRTSIVQRRQTSQDDRISNFSKLFALVLLCRQKPWRKE